MKLKEYISIFESKYKEDSRFVDIKDPESYTIRLTRSSVSDDDLYISFRFSDSKKARDPVIMTIYSGIDELKIIKDALDGSILDMGINHPVVDLNNNEFKLRSTNGGMIIKSLNNDKSVFLDKDLCERLYHTITHYLKTNQLYEVNY